MKRTLEPELMNDEEQVEAYAKADFESGHSKIIELIDEFFSWIDFSGEILDLGCGPGDITFRLADRYPKANITAIDGSQVMLNWAEQRKILEKKEIRDKIHFFQTILPSADIPKKAYDLIISTSFLHHLHQPDILWQTIKECSCSGSKIFIADLCRPTNKLIARGIVNECAKNEPIILKEDFYNSLLAAFTPEEVQSQLMKANLSQLSIFVDRYLIVNGTI